MALTDTACRNAKGRDKPYKLGDSAGLFLLVQPNGGRLWRLKYRVAGKEKKLGLGTYPEVSLAEARERRDHARRQLLDGADPAVEKRRAKLRASIAAEHTFATVAREYMDKRGREGWAPATANKAEFLLAQLSPIAALPIADIAPADILPALRKVEAKGKLETARRSLQFASNVFRYAVATARLGSDPTRDLRGALTAPRSKNHAAIVDAARAGELLRAIDGYTGHAATRLALQIAPHVFVRPGELRQADWSEFDLDAATWTIPAARMKMRKPHTVPLSRQVLALLNAVREANGRATGLLFPSLRTSHRPMSENTLNAALRRLGYSGDEMTAHGFRAMASTLLNESGKWSSDAIERALAHQDSDEVRAAYHRGTHWKERVAMAQWWSDHLDTLRRGAEVVTFPGRSAF